MTERKIKRSFLDVNVFLIPLVTINDYFHMNFRYSLSTLVPSIPPCTVICQDPLPKANNESKMTLKEVIPLLPNWADGYNKLLNASDAFNKHNHLFRYQH